MAEFHSLSELVHAGEQRSPQPEKRTTRLTPTPDFGSGVNNPACGEGSTITAAESAVESQVLDSTEVGTIDRGGGDSIGGMQNTGAGYHEMNISVNHVQVLAPQQTPDEIRQHLAKLGVNLTEVARGRKHVFDDFMQGRLVSLLAMGLSIRQAGSALGVSHVAVWKELNRNPELNDQVNAARFQAQIEPLLVILRESKKSWRAATWLVNYLSKSVAKREETPDEAKQRGKRETEEFYRDTDAMWERQDQEQEARRLAKAQVQSGRRKKSLRTDPKPPPAPAKTSRELAKELKALEAIINGKGAPSET